MTARTAAQEEAERYKHGLIAGCNGVQFDVADVKRRAFVDGAVWGAALVTPTREQIAKAMWEAAPTPDRPWEAAPEAVREAGYVLADAVLALLQPQS